MNKAGKKLSVAAAALIVVLVAAIGAFAALAIGVSAGNIQKMFSMSEITIADFDGTPVSAEKAAQIIESDSKYPLGTKIVTYDNDGSRVALDDVAPETYDGFIASVNVEDDGVQEKMHAAIESGLVSYVTDKVVSAASLDVLSQFFAEDDLGLVEPDYAVYAFEGEGAAVADADAVVDAIESYASTESDTISTNYFLDFINAPTAWSSSLTGKGVTIAVIDSGLMGTGSGDTKHEDIDYGARVLEGRNCMDADTGDEVAASSDALYFDTATPDGFGHGTFVAGEIIANHANGGAKGIAPEASIRPYKILDNAGKGKVSYLVRALQQAIIDKVDVATMSLGSPGIGDTLKQYCQDAVDAGIIVIAACGNDGEGRYVNNQWVPYERTTNRYPAAYDCVIGVSSVNNQWGLAATSAYGKDNAYVSAPGDDIYGLGISSSTAYRTMSGTSMAAPQVASFAALTVQKFGQLNQDKSLNQETFMSFLKDLVQDKGATGRDIEFGLGVIDCSKLVSATQLNVPVAFGFNQGKNTEKFDWKIKGNGELSVYPSFGATGSLYQTLSSAGKASWAAYSSTIKTVKVEKGIDAGSDTWYLFSNLPNCSRIDLSSMTAAKVGSMKGMFEGCTSLTNVTFPADGVGTGVDTLYIASLFKDCTSLREVDLGKLQPQKNIDPASDAFSGCTLRSITLGDPWRGGSLTVSPISGSDSYGHAYNGKWLNPQGEEVAGPNAAGTFTPAVAHVAGTPTVTKVATCTTPGVRTALCTLCNAVASTEEIPVDANAHDWAPVTWTWTDDNSSATASRACRHNTAHTENKTATSTATDYEGGVEYTATATFDGKQVTTSKRVSTSGSGCTQHDWGTPVIVKEPTCTEAGLREWTCTKGDATQTESIPALGHTWGNPVITAPTCTASGTIVRTCSVCHETTTEQNGAALGHNYKTVVTKEPTCTEAGSQHEACTREGCGTIKEGSQTTIAALGHNMVTVKPAQSATCTSTGSTELKRCAREGCDHAEGGAVIPMLAHSFAVVQMKAPTCQATGLQHEACGMCGLVKEGSEQEIAKLAHSWRDAEITTQPTCTETGVRATRCASCNELGAEKTVDALGHNYQTVVTKPATCEETGISHEACEREGCDAVKEGSEKEVAALGHDWGEPEWQWDSAKLAADAKFVCSRDEAHTDTVEAEVAAQWGEDDAIERTATVKHHDKEFSDKVVVKNPSLKSVTVNSDAADAGFDASIAGIPVDSKVELSVDPVSEGRVHDAIVRKAAGNSMTILAGVYDINLRINDEAKDSDFGTLTLIFPVNSQFNGQAVTIHHCHGNDVDNIESTDGYIVEDGKVVVKNVTKLSTFAVEVNTGADGGQGIVAPETDAQPNTIAPAAAFAVTGDQMLTILLVLAVAAVAAVVVVLCIVIPMSRRRRKK